MHSGRTRPPACDLHVLLRRSARHAGCCGREPRRGYQPLPDFPANEASGTARDTPPRSAPSRWSFPTADTPSMPSPTSARTPGRCPKPRCGRCAAHGTLTDQTPERFPCPPCGRLPCAARRRSLLNSCGPWRRSISATPWLPDFRNSLSVRSVRLCNVPRFAALFGEGRITADGECAATEAFPADGDGYSARLLPPGEPAGRERLDSGTRSRRTRPMPRNMPLIS